MNDEAFYDAPELCGPDPVPASVPVPKRRAIDGPLRHTYRVIRDGYRARCAAAGLSCAICRNPIDYRLVHGDPWAFELDHVIAVEDDPNLALAEKNFQPSHSRCNKRKAILQAMERDAGGGGAVAGTFVVPEGAAEGDGGEYPGAYRVVDGHRQYWDEGLGYPSEIWP